MKGKRKKKVQPPVVDTRVQQLQTELEDAIKQAEYQRGRREQAEGQAKKLEEENRRAFNRVEEAYREVMGQMEWMRMVVELITVPVEKMELLDKIKSERHGFDPKYR